LNLTLFDLDGTLLPFDSDHAFGEYMVRIGWADGEAFRHRNDAFYAAYQAGTLDLDAYVHFATASWRDRADAEAARTRFVAEVVAPQLHPRARALVQQHRDAGDLTAIVTATNEFVTEPIAALFCVDRLLAVELARDAAGRIDGRIAGVPSFREGKIERVDAWLAASGRTRGSFERVTVYSDSSNDLPLLDVATHPVATNPSPSLEAIARERGWPILRLFE
jgi:HAD superfamily hydrolase (TIGR01490 family)